MADKKERDVPLLDEYLEDFGLARKEVGSVNTLVLGERAFTFGFQAELVGKENIWSLLTGRMPELYGADPELVESWREAIGRSVRGIVKELPFAAEEFPLVLAYNAFEETVGEKELKIFFHEIIRVLAPGGTALIYSGWTDFRPVAANIRVIGVVNAIADLAGVTVAARKVTKKHEHGIAEGAGMVIIRKNWA